MQGAPRFAQVGEKGAFWHAAPPPLAVVVGALQQAAAGVRLRIGDGWLAPEQRGLGESAAKVRGAKEGDMHMHRPTERAKRRPSLCPLLIGAKSAASSRSPAPSQTLPTMHSCEFWGGSSLACFL